MLVDMDDRTYIQNPRDNVHHYHNKINCVFFSFVFLMVKLKKNIMRADIREFKTALLAFQRIYIYQQTRQKRPPMLRVFFICTRLSMQVSYVNKLEMNNLLY